MHFIKDRALLKEAIGFNSIANFDTIRALGMVMLYRGAFVDLYEGDLSRANRQNNILVEDSYFSQYDDMISQYNK